MTPSVYICVEEAAREWTSKLLLAACLAERGLNVVVGQQWLLKENFEHLPPGMVLFKGNNGIQLSYMRLAKSAGHAVASLEEESFAVLDEAELRRYYDSRVESCCDLFLVPGQFQRDLLSTWFPGAVNRIKITGNPRIDLFRPGFLASIKEESRRLREAHGRFVLCNLNYATVNTLLGETLSFYETCVAASIYRRNNADDERAYLDLMQWERDNLTAMVRLIGWLERNLPNIKILVRPHPAERYDIWEQALSGRDRIMLVRGGSHLPWTLASEVMAHTSCTTGTEAFLAGHHAVSLCASRIPIAEGYLSNFVNPRFATHVEAGDHIPQICVNDTAELSDERHRFDDILDHHLEGRRGQLASDRVADAVADFLPARSDQNARSWAVGSGFQRDRTTPERELRKMGTMVVDAEAQLETIKAALGRFRGLQVTEVGRAVYRVGTA